jgi:hypothetical protein
MTTHTSSPTGADFAQSFVAGQKVLKRYTLNRVLGQGGMGIVWMAHDEELDLDVALKFLPSLVVNDRASLNDLKRETRRSLELTHPNIVRTYDFLQDGALAGIAMEYVDSDTLRNRRIDQPSGVFQPADLGEWTGQLCSALDYAHGTASIVHRDLKPANLLINGRNHLKVADFGISRSLVESVTQVTGGNSVTGTLVYMSPQQLEGNPAHPLDDIYAVGATLYELCTSRPPFFTGDISRQVHMKTPPPMADRRAELGIPHSELPQNWETTVAACLAKDPAQRPQSAGEIAVHLGLKEAASITTTASAFPAPAPMTSGAGTARSLPGAAANPATVSTGMLPVSTLPAVAGLKIESAGVAKRRSWVPLAAAAVLVVLAVAAGIWFLTSRLPVKAPVATAATAPAPSIPAAAPAAVLAPAVLVPDPAKEAARLAAARGSIFVESDPAGAIVKVDDRPAEKTPVPLKDLTLGSHTLKVTLDGYDDYTGQVDVKEGQITEAGKIKLVRSTGWLSVTMSPVAGDLTVSGPDGVKLQQHNVNPWNSDKLPSGDYEVTVTRAGWQPITQKVTLSKDQSLAVPFDLTGGSVQIDSVPAKATVLLAGKPVGTTPYVLQDVQPGDYQYSLAAAGYTNIDLPGTVEPGQVLKLDGKLPKVAAAHVASHTRTRHTGGTGSNGGSSESGDPHAGEDGLDKANRAADLATKIRALNLPFPHP